MTAFLLFTLELTNAFEIFWNVPSQQCKQVQPSKYNITANAGNKFRGEKLVIFYEPDLGLYPYFVTPEIDKRETKMINGGVPQEVDMEAHLEKVRLDITRK